jgi:hypothetical protein
VILLGSVSWGSSPKIPIAFSYEKQRIGADMQYRVQVTISPVTSSHFFGYPIYMGLIIEGNLVKTVTLKDASPSQWGSAITYTSEWYAVPNKTSGTTSVAFNMYSGSGSSRNDTYSYSIVVDSVASEVSASDGTLSTTLDLNVTRYNTRFTHTITYTCGNTAGSTTGYVCQNSTADTVAWDNTNGNVSHLATFNKSGQSVIVTFTITTYDGTTVIGTNSTMVTMKIPDNVRPDVALSVEDAAGYLATYGAYVQGWSKLKLTATATLAHGSPIGSFYFESEGAIFSEGGGTGHLSKTFTVPSVIQGKGTLSVSTRVRDYRNRSSDWISKDITVLPYSNPSVTVVAYRCNSSGAEDAEGAYMRVGFNASLADLNGKNSASYSLTYTGASSPITGQGTSYLSAAIPCDVTKTWAVEVTVSDDLASTTKSAVIPIAFTLMDFYNTGKGIAFGKVATRDGFDCAMDAYFTGSVTVANKLLVDLIYPVGSIYMSTNNASPQTFFGGTWERIQDRFLLAAGSTYTAGGTGGSATHTLTVNEMPNHDHVLKVATSTTTASDAALRASGVKAYSSQIADSPNDNIKDVGGNAAHNNMPPYLTVYMWKRTK